MGHVRFRRSFKVAPGVKLNISKKGISTTIGGKGAHYTINSKGKRTQTVGIPGTGLSYVNTSSGKTGKVKKAEKSTPHTVKKSTTHTDNKADNPITSTDNSNKQGPSLFLLIIGLVFSPVLIYLIWAKTNWNKVLKILLTIILAIWFTLLCMLVVPSSSSEDNNEPLPTASTTVITTTTSTTTMTTSTTIVQPELPQITFENNVWGVYNNGVLDDTYNGIGNNDSGKWVIRNGQVDFDYSGQYVSNGLSYLVDHGKVVE